MPHEAALSASPPNPPLRPAGILTSFRPMSHVQAPEISETIRTNTEMLMAASHDDPFSFLGPHRIRRKDGLRWVVRVFRPDAIALTVLLDGGQQPFQAELLHPGGLFEVELPGDEHPPSYSLEWETKEGEISTMDGDPYQFGPLLGDQDVYFLREGTHRRLWEIMGAKPRVVDGVAGVAFAVWAPNARRVSVIGDFNYWDGRIHPMRKRLEAGAWEIFIPGVPEGAHYKFEIVGSDYRLFAKSDPMAYFSQNRQATASLVHDLNQYTWGDADWLHSRRNSDCYHEPVSIYEVHLNSWARVAEENDRLLTYREFADKLVKHVVEMGFTHIELLPVSEYPFDGSWGYQVTGYFAPTSRYGSPDDFRYFVDTCHRNGIGVILDWVPAHFPKDAHGLAWFDGTPLYEHADPREGEHRDWGTLIFNYGRNEVRNFLVSNALFWFDEYHIDGLRVDAVASMLYRDYSREDGEWVPNQFGGRENLEAIDFLRELNRVCYEEHPGIMMIAEESTAFGGVSRPVDTGGLGFGFKWNMGWMHDSLEYMSKDPVHRVHHHDTATFSMLYAYDENFILVLSHDEVVHGKRSLLDKMPGDRWQKFANLRLFLAWMFGHPGKKLLFQDAVVAPLEEWDHERSLSWRLLQYPEHNGVNRLLHDLNHLYRNEKALHELDHTCDGFEWIEANDAQHSIFSFLRKAKDGSPILAVINATPVPRPSYRLGVPGPGSWVECFNSDAAEYAGSGMRNPGSLKPEALESHGRPHTLTVDIPPLATVFFKPE